MQALTSTVPRYVFALVMCLFGLGHMMNSGAMAGMVPIPGGVFWVYLTGAGLLAAGISMIIGKMAKLSTLLLGVMLLIFALTIHLPGWMGGNEAQMAQFLKDLGLSMAAFTWSGIFAGQEVGEKVAA